ncbi:MAG TPA: lysophospholipid acyltransferase family protein [Burkholderiales bacterium]|nr:lysophospholipid acyltransferase family protein [Burkholderiales bacterium]
MSRLGNALGNALTGFTRVVTGARPRWLGCAPSAEQRIYFGNHTSHADFALIWSSLPRALRRQTRPVAGADYWGRGRLRRYVIREVLRGVLVERGGHGRAGDAIDIIVGALEGGDSLIVFPEGTRNTTDEVLLPFKSGLYRVACRRPDVALVPVWMENLGRVLPKGDIIPVPLLCSVSFGAPMRLLAGEDKEAFLGRTRQALLDLAASTHPR